MGRARAGAGAAGAPTETRSFWRRQRDDLLRDGLVGVVALVVAFALAAWWDSRLEVRAQSVENTRFVRQVALDGASRKPFGGLVLRDAELSGLDLGCTDVGSARAGGFVDDRVEAGCADLRGADLRGAVLRRTDLAHALLDQAVLRDADLSFADLRGAVLGADLSGATLFKADLSEADLGGADLTDADLSVVCYDDATVWPSGYLPPEPPDCTDSGDRIRIVEPSGS